MARVNGLTVPEIPKVLLCPGLMSLLVILMIKVLCVTEVPKFPCQSHCNEL